MNTDGNDVPADEVPVDDVPADDGPITRFVPEYGPIEAALGYGLFYVLVAVGTPVLDESARAILPGLDVALVPTAGAAALWVILILSVIGQVGEQFRENPRQFPDRESARRFLDAAAPSLGRMGTWAGLAAVGGVITVLGAGQFLESFQVLLASMILIAGEAGVALSLRDVVFFVGYILGFSVFTRYTDRLILGSIRRWMRRDVDGWPGELNGSVTR